MPGFDRIVGYAYAADIHCPDCIHAVALAHLHNPDTHRDDDTETTLTAWAKQKGFTYPTGASNAPDTNDFPSPIFAISEDADDRCNNCGNHLLDD